MTGFGTRNSSACERCPPARPAAWRARALVAGLTITVGATPTPLVRAAAPGNKAACVNAYEQAQRLRKASKLVEANEELRTCEQACPSTLRADCEQWRVDTEQRTPTLSITALDAQGHEAQAVRVVMDEQPLAVVLDGRPIPVDPGAHVFRFESDTSLPVTLQLAVREGEKNRLVSVRLERPSESPSAGRSALDDHRTSPGLGFYIAAGVGAVGLIGAGYFSAARVNDVGTLADCKPSCAATDVRNANVDLYLAATSLVVALAGGGCAVYLLFRDPPHAAGRVSLGLPLIFGLTPEGSGLRATLGARF
jgi:hypothetical protein